jgi:hypothetical protein
MMLGISWLAEDLLASKEALDGVSLGNRIIFIQRNVQNITNTLLSKVMIFWAWKQVVCIVTNAPWSIQESPAFHVQTIIFEILVPPWRMK